MALSSAELAVAKLSRKQHGAWSRRQALARGMGQLKRRMWTLRTRPMAMKAVRVLEPP